MLIAFIPKCHVNAKEESGWVTKFHTNINIPNNIKIIEPSGVTKGHFIKNKFRGQIPLSILIGHLKHPV